MVRQHAFLAEVLGVTLLGCLALQPGAAHAQASAADSAGEDEAVRLQAQAADRLLQDDPAGALDLLRRAQARAPDDAYIAYDLARAALSQSSQTLKEDTAALLRLPPVSEDARLLQGYVLAHQGDAQGARAIIDGVLAGSPTHSEALLVRDMLDQAAPAPTTSRVTARVSAGGEVDSNVTLLPQDIPSRRLGERLAASGSLRVTPLIDPVQIDLAVNLHANYHLNDRAALRDYDVAGGTAWVALRKVLGELAVSADGIGSLVYAGERGPAFMRDLFAQVEARHVGGTVQPGIYAMAGWRDFGRFNDTGGINDRTGPHAEAGLLTDVPGACDTPSTCRPAMRDGPKLNTVSGALRLGYFGEYAAGPQQHVQGIRAAALGRLAHGPLGATLALGYAWRDYDQSVLHRADHLIEPSLEVSLVLTEPLVLVASYLLVHNASLKPYTYTRHVGALALEARW